VSKVLPDMGVSFDRFVAGPNGEGGGSTTGSSGPAADRRRVGEDSTWLSVYAKLVTNSEHRVLLEMTPCVACAQAPPGC
jgi:hypothetical protein